MMRTLSQSSTAAATSESASRAAASARERAVISTRRIGHRSGRPALEAVHDLGHPIIALRERFEVADDDRGMGDPPPPPGVCPADSSTLYARAACSHADASLSQCCASDGGSW